uniref:Immunoglobulin V-set domain-containing protein n=1 Tax=Neolamprologus brichardi TaxID=32507 RepID=A0A3Q4NBF1_NEOBR
MFIFLTDSCCNSVTKIKSYKEDSVTISCPYESEYQNNLKYICRGTRPSTCLQQALITSDNKENGRFRLDDDKVLGKFTVSITRLTRRDSGLYLCGSGLSYSQWSFFVVNGLLQSHNVFLLGTNLLQDLHSFNLSVSLSTCLSCILSCVLASFSSTQRSLKARSTLEHWTLRSSAVSCSTCSTSNLTHEDSICLKQIINNEPGSVSDSAAVYELVCALT